MNSGGDITQLLQAARKGDAAAESQLLEAIYGELRKLAASHMRRERYDHTLQPSALVNEAYMQLFTGHQTDWQSRAQFYAAAGITMRRLLIGHARERLALKRGGGWQKVDVSTTALYVEDHPEQWIALENCLVKLEKIDPRQGEVVNLRFFCGLSVEETAAAMDISEKTVKRDWAMARAWLQGELENEQ